ncbi:hypothetical protein EVAR_62242_1 [Eumeta japonica]|uniref:Uncharacterized protein n=1 Tax=Eumeta variegata TaxID=151549 RepID=A0A4C1ZFM6_EUMVA|nr:hypothetical protein EVAR_62242_1 [Eumeta japonica]
MRRLMDVSEAREICKDRTMWRSIISAYPSGKWADSESGKENVIDMIFGDAVGQIGVKIQSGVAVGDTSAHVWAAAHALFFMKRVTDMRSAG